MFSRSLSFFKKVVWATHYPPQDFWVDNIKFFFFNVICIACNMMKIKRVEDHYNLQIILLLHTSKDRHFTIHNFLLAIYVGQNDSHLNITSCIS